MRVRMATRRLMAAGTAWRHRRLELLYRQLDQAAAGVAVAGIRLALHRAALRAVPDDQRASVAPIVEPRSRRPAAVRVSGRPACRNEIQPAAAGLRAAAVTFASHHVGCCSRGPTTHPPSHQPTRLVDLDPGSGGDIRPASQPEELGHISTKSWWSSTRALSSPLFSSLPRPAHCSLTPIPISRGAYPTQYPRPPRPPHIHTRDSETYKMQFNADGTFESYFGERLQNGLQRVMEKHCGKETGAMADAITTCQKKHGSDPEAFSRCLEPPAIRFGQCVESAYVVSERESAAHHRVRRCRLTRAHHTTGKPSCLAPWSHTPSSKRSATASRSAMEHPRSVGRSPTSSSRVRLLPLHHAIAMRVLSLSLSVCRL